MKKNLGSMDRTVRILIAIGIVILWFTDIISGTGGIILMVLAAVLLWTAFMSYCPLYHACRIRTNRKTF